MLMFCFRTLQNVPFLRLSAGLLACVCLSAALTKSFAGQIGMGAEGRHGGLAPDIAAQRLNDAICKAWTVRVPDLSMGLCTTSGLQPTGGRSVQGEPLYRVDIRAGSPQLRVIVVGGIHGDELTSTTLAMHWLQIATDDPSIAYWRFIPLLNPDGMLASPAKRMNANGVDLNRNFPTKNWAVETKHYWEKRTRRDPRRWPGKFAGSEPETQFLLNEIHAFQPDLIVSIHAPYGILDFDGALTPPKKLGRLHLDRLGIYPGSVGNYGSLEHHVPVVTVELLHAIDAPTATETQQMWGDLIGWMKNRLLSDRYSDLVEQGSHKHLN
jgi:murein peptide amidase A